MYISEYFKLQRGHENFDFIDIDTSKDAALFIDPCLIEVGNSSFCNSAVITMNDYFNSFYDLYREKVPHSNKIKFFSHAHEINATKLGYGTGKNGKAKTADGMIETFESLQRLIDSNVPVSKAIDLPIFIRNFAEDCLSDMLTNILFSQLNEYTVSQCKKYDISLHPLPNKYHYWDIASHSWKPYQGDGLLIDGEPILLVPKKIVRHSFYYNTEQYFRSIILEKMQEEQTTLDTRGKELKPSKKSLREKLLSSHSDILDISEEETMKEPTLLAKHHDRMNGAYSKRHLSDEELNSRVYI